MNATELEAFLQSRFPCVPGHSAWSVDAVERKGHRIRAQISGAFHPHFSRNLQTGAFEGETARMRRAKISILQSKTHPSRIILPVLRD